VPAAKVTGGARITGGTESTADGVSRREGGITRVCSIRVDGRKGQNL